MTDEELAEALTGSVNDAKNGLEWSVVEHVKKYIEANAAQMINVGALRKIIDESNIVHVTLLDWMRPWVANEVGNRLRCGIYDGTVVNKAFESIWTEQFQMAIEDRVREKARKAVDAVIAERLKGI